MKIYTHNTLNMDREKRKVDAKTLRVAARAVGVNWLSKKVKSLDKTKPANFGEGRVSNQ
ncbi:hypothetical protein [Pseudoalteromonas umbrosa]|uniref:hypothetical protein n=1 Tax=Pseudoalteromonas umbrosa TaxID=3048489 RepID=UPI0024C4439E|nr:hypothetical protein [Pseudoalteromonas sp. B95]MDK1289805.1 hypothetical protein [Pseudoalteromonas sp. B95]